MGWGWARDGHREVVCWVYFPKACDSCRPQPAPPQGLPCGGVPRVRATICCPRLDVGSKLERKWRSLRQALCEGASQPAAAPPPPHPLLTVFNPSLKWFRSSLGLLLTEAFTGETSSTGREHMSSASGTYQGCNPGAAIQGGRPARQEPGAGTCFVSRDPWELLLAHPCPDEQEGLGGRWCVEECVREAGWEEQVGGCGHSEA